MVWVGNFSKNISAPLSLIFNQIGIHGRIRSDLARSGTPIGPNDMLIAATAAANGLTLVTANTREFGRAAGLSLENWENAF